MERAAPRESNNQFFFEEGPLPNSGQAEGVNVLEDDQITFQASHVFQGPIKAWIEECPRLLNQVRTMFHRPKVSSISCKPVKYSYATRKREHNLSKSKVVF